MSVGLLAIIAVGIVALIVGFAIGYYRGATENVHHMFGQAMQPNAEPPNETFPYRKNLASDELTEAGSPWTIISDYRRRLERIAAITVGTHPTRNLRKAIKIATEG